MTDSDDAPPHRGRRVLVVDLNRDEGMRTLRRMLRLAGYAVKVDHVAAMVLSRALSWRPHVAIVDLRDTGEAATELLLTLRQVPNLAESRLVGVVGGVVDDNAFDAFAARGIRLRTLFDLDDILRGDDDGLARVRAH